MLFSIKQFQSICVWSHFFSENQGLVEFRKVFVVGFEELILNGKIFDEINFNV